MHSQSPSTTHSPPVTGLRRRSLSVRSRTCVHCNRSFRRIEHLERHVRTHTKEKPYTCPCGAAFSRRDLLKRHIGITGHQDRNPPSPKSQSQIGRNPPPAPDAPVQAPFPEKATKKILEAAQPLLPGSGPQNYTPAHTSPQLIHFNNITNFPDPLGVPLGWSSGNNQHGNGFRAHNNSTYPQQDYCPGSQVCVYPPITSVFGNTFISQPGGVIYNYSPQRDRTTKTLPQTQPGNRDSSSIPYDPALVATRQGTFCVTKATRARVSDPTQAHGLGFEPPELSAARISLYAILAVQIINQEEHKGDFVEIPRMDLIEDILNQLSKNQLQCLASHTWKFAGPEFDCSLGSLLGPSNLVIPLGLISFLSNCDGEIVNIQSKVRKAIIDSPMLSQFPSYDDSQPGLFMANQERNHSQHRYQNSDYSLVPSVPILEAVYCGESQLPAAQRQLPMESRDRSPFRQSSPLSAGYNNDMFQQSPVSNSPNAHPMLERQVESPNIISPKDAVMHDFDQSKDRKLPYLHQPDFELRQDDTLRLASSFPFIEPFPQLGQAQAPFQQFIFSQPQQGQQDSLLYQTPEFPAFLPQFESADGGTYTCTYHGCTQRFETLRKLQNHKRGAHRRTTTEDRRDGISRNSQAGPHRCDRANIRTGKPCGSIFSRPWDLTRHENTFHNAHKREFRCNFCTKKRIFSRNDALIRHIRVVHPVRQLARSG